MTKIYREVIDMPRRDGWGPAGVGRGTGLGRQTNTGVGRGRMGGPASAGSAGYCECPNCGEKVKHLTGEPCSSLKCPKCDTTMVRA